MSWACALSPEICGTLTPAGSPWHVWPSLLRDLSSLDAPVEDGFSVSSGRDLASWEEAVQFCSSHKSLDGGEVKTESQASLMRRARGWCPAGTLNSPAKKEHCSLYSKSQSIVFCKVLSKCLIPGSISFSLLPNLVSDI